MLFRNIHIVLQHIILDFCFNHRTDPPTDCSQNASSNMERKGYMTVLLCDIISIFR